MTGFPHPDGASNTEDEPNRPIRSSHPALPSTSHPSPRREFTRHLAESFEIQIQGRPDVVCFSHLRWDFVFQRPQHLLTRSAKDRHVFYIEEPIFDAVDSDTMQCVTREGGVIVVTPHLHPGLPEREIADRQRNMVNDLLREREISDYILWYYTPMAMGFTRHLFPRLVVWDCMDELSAFAGAPPALLEREKQLLAWADLVFTGGQSLYEAKRDRHDHVHAFPGSIDGAHFAKARRPQGDSADQANIPHPRIGFYGVIDERLDIDLLGKMAELRPDWHWVLIGPVVKIDPRSLPRAANIHYLGKKDYGQLPNYLSGWDAAMLPFARNESTRFISPTKTPEYLAAGRPVASTSIKDVVRPYADANLVRIADEPAGFIAALEAAMAEGADSRWLSRIDEFLSGNSWDRTHADMLALVEAALDGKTSSAQRAETVALRRPGPVT